MKTNRHNKGYLQVVLCDGKGKKKKVSVHVLVALAFVGPKPADKQVVRHLDGNPSNNAASNLAWGTYKENEDDKIAHGTWGSRSGGASLTEKAVREIRLRYASGESQKSLAAEYGVSRSTVTRVVNNTIWKHV